MPIETIYKGYKFRSRLEARWAVFFDTLGIPFEYEKEGFDIDGIRYLPDFWMPNQKFWVEIKGEEPTEQDLQKIRALGHYGNAPVALFVGPPMSFSALDAKNEKTHEGRFFCIDVTDSAGGECIMMNVMWAYCNNCKVFTLDFGDFDERYFEGRRQLCNPDFTKWDDPCKCFPPKNHLTSFSEVFEAGGVARQARFEFTS